MAMETQTATKAVTNTHLSVALAMLLASGGLAYMAGAGSLPSSTGSSTTNPNSCSLSQFNVSEACEKTYRGSKMRCYDGKTITVNSCVTNAEARAMCNGHCRGNKCGVDNFNQGTACEQQYKNASGSCSDGFAVVIGGVNGDNNCKTASSLRLRMENTCATRYCGPTNTGELTFTASAHPNKIVAVGGTEGATQPIFQVTAAASVEDVEIRKLEFFYYPVPGSNEQSAFRQLELYNSTNSAGNFTGTGSPLLATAALVPSQTSGQPAKITFTLSAGSLIVPTNSSVQLSVVSKFNSLTDGTQSAMSPFIQLGDGTTPDTDIVQAVGVQTATVLNASAINGSDTLNIRGSHTLLYKSFPIVQYDSQNVSETLVNGVEQNIYSFKVRSNFAGDIALKQFKFSIDVLDNVGTSNNLSVSDFKFYKGTTDFTSRVRFMKDMVGYQAMSTVTSTSSTPKIFYVTFKDDTSEIVSAGSESTYTIKATLNGFTADSDNDMIRVRMLNTEATSGELSQVNDPYFLTSLPWAYNQYLRVAGLSKADGSSMQPADFIWSDLSAATHSASIGRVGAATTSTGEWYNGYLIETPANYANMVR